MPKTWVARGEFGTMLINEEFVESVTVLPSSPGIYAVRIKMISGSGYNGYFRSEEELNTFVTAWATERTPIDMEPIYEPVVVT